MIKRYQKNLSLEDTEVETTDELIEVDRLSIHTRRVLKILGVTTLSQLKRLTRSQIKKASKAPGTVSDIEAYLGQTLTE